MSATAGGRRVHKVHGAHNTFALVDERLDGTAPYGALARALCSREHLAADGLLVVAESGEAGALARMRIFNADGGEAEMCGNGVRCVARYLAERGAPSAFTIATTAGPIAAEILGRDPWSVRVGLGPVRRVEERALDLAGERRAYVFVDVGNPHAVLFVPDVDAVDLAELGVRFAAQPEFPEGINVHVASIAGSAHLRARHYERGVGLTQACGTGAVACAVAAMHAHGLHSPIAVDVPGGRLEVALEERQTWLTGPAEVEFERTVAE